MSNAELGQENLSMEETYALILITAAHAAYANGISAAAAWNREYEIEHVKYLTDAGVPAETVQECLDKSIHHFIG
jgi:hypothetical protein